jgi:hypothetical protein
MPVPFRDLRGDGELGLAGYLRFIEEEDGRGIRGALFLVNARGEPIDFSFSRTDVSAPFLWRSGTARRHAIAGLAAALFQGCPNTPKVLLALADEVHPRLFTEDLLAEVPLCRVAQHESDPASTGESIEMLSGTVHLFWLGRPPESESAARRLLDALVARQLTVEPFERAARGIEEAFSE